jgi:hypothetical protein
MGCEMCVGVCSICVDMLRLHARDIMVGDVGTSLRFCNVQSFQFAVCLTDEEEEDPWSFAESG